GLSVSFAGIALDLINKKIYYTEGSATASLDAIKRANLDGTGVEPLATDDNGGGANSNFTQPGDIALDVANGHMYLVDVHATQGKGIIRYNLDGSGRTVVINPVANAFPN